MDRNLGYGEVLGIGEENVKYNKYFTGTSYLQPLTTSGLVISQVTFEPGCRNFWHIHHKGGQILIITGGQGWYQEEGKKARALKEGDVVNIPPEVKHWHGASSTSWFSHICLGVPAKDSHNEWCEPVSDEEYRKVEEK